MPEDRGLKLRFLTFALAVFASTSFVFQGCTPNKIETDDPGRPVLYGKEILRHAEEKDRFENQLIVHLQAEATMWRDAYAHLAAALDTLNAFVRDSTKPVPPDFRPLDCPGPDCGVVVPPPSCKLRPDCN